jgi:hypothetical protein
MVRDILKTLRRYRSALCHPRQKRPNFLRRSWAAESDQENSLIANH